MHSSSAPTGYILDQTFSTRFDSRVRKAMWIIFPAHLLAIAINAIVDTEGMAALYHVATLLMAWGIFIGSRDMLSFLLLSSTYLTFSLSLYVYSCTIPQVASFGLYDPAKAAAIAACSQAAQFLAFILLPKTPPLPRSRANVYETRQNALANAHLLLIAIGLIPNLLRTAIELPDIVFASFQLLFYVGLAIRVLVLRGKLWNDPIILFAVGSLFILSIVTNARTTFFAIALLLGFAILCVTEKPFTARNIVIAFIAVQFVSVFSGISLSIRGARDTGASFLLLAADAIFSWETLQTLFNPLHVHEAVLRYHAESEPNYTGFYTAFYGVSSGFLSRLTVLPQMDIVSSKLSPNQIDWNELYKVLISALPSFGQEKSLIFSDEVVWNLGLRDPNNIGRPMITAQGELFALGGYSLTFLVIFLCYFFGAHLIRAISIVTGSRLVAILIATQILQNGIFSTTLLSVVISFTRTPAQLIVVLAILIALSPRTSAPNRGALQHS